MKKCPKCGTILDDSKVKCYICGTDLQRQNLTSFGNNFNESIGATVSNNQGNVFSQNNNIQNGMNQGSTNTIVSNSNYSNSLYNNQLNNLNSMAFDDRTALEKMFSSDDRFKSKNEINAEKAIKENQKRNNFVNAFNNSVSNSQQQGVPRRRPVPNGANPSVNGPVSLNGRPPVNMPPQAPAQPLKKGKKGLFKKKKKEITPVVSQPVPQAVGNGQQGPNAPAGKPPINWGNNLTNNDPSGNTAKKEKVNLSLIFNILALVISITGVLLVYFKVVRPDSETKVSHLGGLKYTISNNFILKDEKSNSKIYNYGELCSIGIFYGPTNAVDSYLDDLYTSIKEEHAKDNIKVNKQTAKYNNNVWTEINLVDIAANEVNPTGYSALTRIQYIAILYEGNFYKIVYQNTQDNAICSASYSSFKESLAFK